MRILRIGCNSQDYSGGKTRTDNQTNVNFKMNVDELVPPMDKAFEDARAQIAAIAGKKMKFSVGHRRKSRIAIITEFADRTYHRAALRDFDEYRHAYQEHMEELKHRHDRPNNPRAFAGKAQILWNRVICEIHEPSTSRAIQIQVPIIDVSITSRLLTSTVEPLMRMLNVDGKFFDRVCEQEVLKGNNVFNQWTKVV